MIAGIEKAEFIKKGSLFTSLKASESGINSNSIEIRTRNAVLSQEVSSYEG